MKLPIDCIVVSKDNPRQTFDEESLRRLGESILAHGQLQPIIVRKQQGNTYELVVGERRLRASVLVGLCEIEAEVRDVDDRESQYLRLIENTEREDLTEAEKGNGIAEILKAYPELTLGDIAKELNKSVDAIKHWLMKTERLSEYVKNSVKSYTISDYFATLILPLSLKEQEKMTKAVLKFDVPTGEHADTHKDFIKKYKLNPEKYPTVESLEDLANEVKGIKKIKVNIAELSPLAQQEIQKQIETHKQEQAQIAKIHKIRNPRQPQEDTGRRGAGRPSKEGKTDFKFVKAQVERGTGDAKPLKQQIAPTIMPNPSTPDYTLCKCATCELFAKHCKGRCWT